MTAAFGFTWPDELAAGVNSSAMAPGGPDTGSTQPEPVVNTIVLSPAAVATGLPSMFWTKLFWGSLEPGVKSYNFV